MKPKKTPKPYKFLAVDNYRIRNDWADIDMVCLPNNIISVQQVEIVGFVDGIFKCGVEDPKIVDLWMVCSVNGIDYEEIGDYDGKIQRTSWIAVQDDKYYRVRRLKAGYSINDHEPPSDWIEKLNTVDRAFIELAISKAKHD